MPKIWTTCLQMSATICNVWSEATSCKKHQKQSTSNHSDMCRHVPTFCFHIAAIAAVAAMRLPGSLLLFATHDKRRRFVISSWEDTTWTPAVGGAHLECLPTMGTSLGYSEEEHKVWTVINCGMSLHLFLYKSVPAWKKCFAMQKAASARAECPSASNLAERNRVTQEFLTTIFADDRQAEKSEKTTNITKLCWLNGFQSWESVR